MSGEPKTLTLTLEEAMRAVHFERLPELRERHGYLADVQMEMTQSGWWVFLNNDGEENQIKEFDRWEDAASFALGVPVVARDEASGEGDDLTAAYMVGLEKGRDEAADLRAAAREWVRARVEYDRQLRASGDALAVPAQVALDLDAAEAELRRLAGGESER